MFLQLAKLQIFLFCTLGTNGLSKRETYGVKREERGGIVKLAGGIVEAVEIVEAVWWHFLWRYIFFGDIVESTLFDITYIIYIYTYRILMYMQYKTALDTSIFQLCFRSVQ